MQLVKVDSALIEDTSRFASEVFIDYYNSLIGHEQAVYMADLFLSPEAIEKLIGDGAIFKLVMNNDEICGFCEYKPEEDGRLFLSKLYAHKAYRHQGLGRLMFEDVLAYARENGYKKIYLTVNKGNIPSYEIYLHLGFKVIDSVVNDIGHGYVMDDYIMEYQIDE
ncbi:MAG: GNAT family N-acetyltransferase [Erysipelotrichaceae bacterium]|nr:GNAT family N-acetyltransferase [Erysipelotrichaceae bacterium]